MKKQLYTTLATLTLLGLLAAIPVCAQSAEIQVKVPFQFKIGDRAFTPGTYVVQRLDNDNNQGWFIQDKTRGEARAFLTDEVHQVDYQESNSLVFENVGGDRYLTEIWIAGHSAGRKLVVNRSK